MKGIGVHQLEQEEILLYWMSEALKEARIAYQKGEIPIGAVVVIGNEVVGRGHNQKEMARDPTAHAEVIALRAAGKVVGSWRLEDATLYVTTEPCLMCWGAILESRIKRVVYGGYPSPEDTSHLGPEALVRLQRRVHIVSGVRAEEASALIRQFFVRRRGFRKACHRLERWPSLGEGARLEIEYPVAVPDRGFKSHPLRQPEK